MRSGNLCQLTPGNTAHAGKDNPANLPSRGLPPQELSANNLWLDGPDWLSDGYLQGDGESQTPAECLIEIRLKDRRAVHGLTTTVDANGIGQVISCEDFSSLDRLLTVTKLVLKFSMILWHQVRPDDSPTNGIRKDTADKLWIAEFQLNSVTDKNFQQWRMQLDLFQDESGLWRCTGRIQNAAVPYSTKHPILLHKSHQLTVLIVREGSQSSSPQWCQETLAELRSKCWIMKGCNFVKSVIHQCRLQFPSTSSTSCLLRQRSTSIFFQYVRIVPTTTHPLVGSRNSIKILMMGRDRQC